MFLVPSFLPSRRASEAASSAADVFLRHLKGCQQNRNHQAGRPTTETVKRKRVKRACDRCAQLKTRCTYGNPCERCSAKGLNCEYRREASLELRLLYGLDKTTTSTENDLANSTGQIPDATSPQSIVTYETEAIDLITSASAMPTTLANSNPLNSLNITSHEVNSPALWRDWPSLDFGSDSASLLPLPQLCGWDENEMVDEALLDVQFPWSPSLATSFNRVADAPPSPVSATGPGDPSNASPKACVPNCFSLAQIDPVEAKCNDLRAHLRGPGPMIPDEVISTFITRQNLLRALELYGQHYQRNIPILHSPTFSLFDSPTLLLAMFCVGACYDETIIPARYVFKIAMRVLINVENQPHEIDMEEPSLSTIQASMAACSVLACSQDEIGQKFVSVYFARNISMGKRARVFDPVEPVNYRNLTVETFDWHAWIKRETRIRIACSMTSQDKACCIFQNSPPSFSPLDLDVELACYEACWEARSAAECLQQLQSTPPQLPVSSAIRQLRTPSPFEGGPTFEASAFGMFVLVVGIHGMFWHATHYDLNRCLDTANSTASATSFPLFEVGNIAQSLETDFYGPSIAILADRAVALHGSSAIVGVNQALDHWARIWNARQFRDSDCENRAFSLDPFPFWCLAKLFLALHCSAPCIPEHSEFANARAKGLDIKDKLLLQAKTFRWLSRLRKRRGSRSQIIPESCLTELMRPSEE
ncbi:uncharacterized protein PAC_03501 [Phialocephala subalpina]|uniref:Zn(2)-C6 fungal-type domain-containing protein n=1 Tax=Phialocephala subalpina TaxID=576137 RepID=A0A1L7WLG4_9HELO|nr:uncharacterized protein PAC_03501 [Phialocephala subalpina]